MWDIKYRPLRFADILGQEGAIQVLKARLRNRTALDTSYIFSGGSGQGKTTLARVLARAMLCTSPGEDSEPCNECDNCTAILSDASLAFHERDAASQGTIDIIRGIVDDLAFVIQGAEKQIHLFDEAHRMSRDAQDVLLKPIEDKSMVGIFCTTEPDKIRGAIRSRCEEHRIRKVTREQILARMKKILELEQVEHEDDAVLTVIDCSGGHVRDVLNRLEMVAQTGPVSIDRVRDYLNLSLVSVYYDVLLHLGTPEKAVGLIEDACERVGPEEVLVGLAEAAMNSYRLANGMFVEFTYTDREKAQKVYEIYGATTLQYAQHFVRSRARSKVGLLCDIVSLVSGVPTQPVTQFQVPAVPKVSQERVEAPAPTGLRSDGIGNKGFDPMAHTSVDINGIGDFPRGHQGASVAERIVVTSYQEEKPLSATQWRRGFERFWRHEA